MRLIDADALIKTYEKETGYKWIEKCILLCPKCFIDNAPTVEERPQGEWIVDKEFNFKKCSKCGEFAEWLDGGSQFLSNYCPNCGADMRGKEE